MYKYLFTDLPDRFVAQHSWSLSCLVNTDSIRGSSKASSAMARDFSRCTCASVRYCEYAALLARTCLCNNVCREITCQTSPPERTKSKKFLHHVEGERFAGIIFVKKNISAYPYWLQISLAADTGNICRHLYKLWAAVRNI